jgi:hypothetical protein
MRFSSENQLNRALRIGQQTHEPLGIVQEKIRALISGEASRKSKRQCVFIKDALGIRRSAAFRCKLTRVSFAEVIDQRSPPFHA